MSWVFVFVFFLMSPFQLNAWYSHTLKVSVTQSCPALCDPMDCSPPGFSVHGILQARIVEWISFPSPEELPNPGIEPWSPALQADSLLFELQESSYTAIKINLLKKKYIYMTATQQLKNLNTWDLWLGPCTSLLFLAALLAFTG